MASRAFTVARRRRPRLRGTGTIGAIDEVMHPYLADAGHVADAASLMSAFGARAAGEAAARASRSRDLGNHLHFCRWRQVERLIVVLENDVPSGTIH